MRASALIFAATLASIGCASAGGAPPQAVEGCDWESRFRPEGSDRDEYRDLCLTRTGDVAAPAGRWRPGQGSRATDPEACLAQAHAGVVRYRACMRDGGFSELSEGRVPYVQPGVDPRAAAIEARRCAERGFEGTRYGPFSVEFETCLTRRGWQRD